MINISWLQQLRPASFRGVRFSVDSISATEGQDVVIREYPFQDLPTFQSMGEGAEEFAVRAYIVGDNYTVGRDRLRDVLRGDGVFIHPTQGHIRCYVKGKFRYTENPTAEGGIARFDFTLMRAEERRYPKALSNPLLEQLAKIQGYIDQASAWFADIMQYAQVAGYVADSIRGDVATLFNQVTSVFPGISHGKFAHVGELAGDVLASATLNGVDVDALSADPQALFLTLTDTISNHVQTSIKASLNPVKTTTEQSTIFTGTPQRNALSTLSDGLLSMASGDFLPAPSQPKYPTHSRLTEQRLKLALRSMTQAVGIVMSIKHVATLANELRYSDTGTPIPRHEYLAHAARLHSAVDALLSAEHDGLAPLQQTVSVAHSQYLQTIAALTTNAGRMTTYTPADSEPLMLVSYKLYGDIDHVPELLANNPDIINPLFVPAGEPLSVVAA